MNATLPLTVTTNTDPFILTTGAQIVEMDVHARGPIPDVIMSLRWTMTSDDYQRFLGLFRTSDMDLTVDAGEGLVLTRDARIVTMDLREITAPITVGMVLHGTMTRETWNLFLSEIMSTPGLKMDVDINRTPDGHFDAHIKTQGDRP